MIEVPYKLLDPRAVAPAYVHPGDAGGDLVAIESVTLSPGERRLVGTGLAVALPPGYVGLITPRSGWAAKAGLSIVNSPGILDAGYRGEVKVCLINLDRSSPIQINAGDRIAQLVIIAFTVASFVQFDELDATVRGDGGYGSTGGASGFMKRSE